MFHINIDNVSFFERNISIVSHLNQFYSKKEKNVWCKWLLVLSLVCIIVYIYSLGKKLFSTYLKTTAWDDTTRKCTNNLQNNGKKKKNVSDFSTISIDDMKTKKI